MKSLLSYVRLPGMAAGVLFVLSVLGFGQALAGYDAWRHPVALLGAYGVPNAKGFNVLGCIVPGLLATLMALRLLSRLPADSRWSLRVAGQLLVLAGLAFAGMGLLPLDPQDLDGAASQAQASAWMVWILAFVSGTLMLGIGGWRRVPALARLAVACGLLAAVSGFALQGAVPAAVAQRIAFAAWAVWLAAALPLVRPQRAVG